MTATPPPDSRPTGPPTGPPAGPLAGPPSGAPPGAPPGEPTRAGAPPGRRRPAPPGPPRPPGGPGGRGGGGGGGGEGGEPWWRSAPRIAIIAGAVAVAVILTFVLTRPEGRGPGELFAEPAAATGQHPLTASSANGTTPVASATPRKAGDATSVVRGSAAGLYGGTQNEASCDTDKQIGYLRSAPARNAAFAGVLGLKPGEVPGYLRSLTSVQLAYDTRVTNHGYKDGKAYAFQSVLQAGTAVMIDSFGQPKVRCKCGNPLTDPQELKGGWQTRGQRWPGYRPDNAVVVKRSSTPVREFTLRNPKTGTWFKRPKGDHGPTSDRPTAPPTDTPSGPPSSQPPPTGSTSPGESPTGTSPEPTSPGAPPASPPSETTETPTMPVRPTDTTEEPPPGEPPPGEESDESPAPPS
ncbi:DUF6777 domain-containing protein [Streptomyces sp. NBRC 110611]|uniref:DUF6777 domain-containing protein n=1 Tax=Streptomyces sp. NBRC 110611 TaxID=1621259 RepID=UPI000A498D1A|nr:DUF6777 domain-containing protein [Streptomyces sp. NBRC 110611]